MEGQNYSNAVPEFSSAEDLDAFLEEGGEVNGGIPPADGQDAPDGEVGQSQQKAKTQPEAKKEAKKESNPFNQNQQAKPKAAAAAEEEEEESEAGEGEEEEQQGQGEGDGNYANMLEYLNETHSLNLNLAALPKELSREQEAEVVSKIIGNMTTGVQRAIAQYKHIEELLQDEEVDLVIKAKSQGKSLRDIANEYQLSTQGMTSESLIRDDLKKRYPAMKEEAMNKMVEGMKSSGEFDGIADAIRQQRVSEEQLSARQRTEAEQRNRQEAEQARQQHIQEFGHKLTTVKDVFGVPVDDQMRAEVFQAATQLDKEGKTYLERALDTDEGVLLATLGLLHMEKLVSAKASLKANKKNKNFIDRVFDTPERLQSGSSRTTDDDMDINLVNRF